MTGTVKTLKEGYGFISGDEGGADTFFHHTALQRPLVFDDLVGGEKVSYDLKSSERGPRSSKSRGWLPMDGSIHASAPSGGSCRSRLVDVSSARGVRPKHTPDLVGAARNTLFVAS